MATTGASRVFSAASAAAAAAPPPPQAPGRVGAAASFENPYAGHRQMSEKEQEVLGEYARLAATIRRVVSLSVSLSSSERHTHLLTDLRILERKMGLVLTLFKASVWSLIQTHQDELEQQQTEQAQHDNDFTAVQPSNRTFTTPTAQANGRRQ